MTHTDDHCRNCERIEDVWTFALDEQGDIQFDERNTIPIATGPRATSQSLRVGLATVQGEDDLDPEFGLDVFEATRGLPTLEREIRRTLLYDDKDHDRVSAVTDVTIYRRPNRRAEVRATVLLEGDEYTLAFNIGGVF